jgi:hypothetical protein
MDFFVYASERNPNLPIRVHPLLLSLTATVNASEIHPDISTISENDERVLRSKHYVSPSAFPPLEIHFLGQNGSSLLSNRNGYALTSTAGCRECVAFSSQDNSGDDFPTQGDSAATSHALEEIATQGDSEATSHPQGDNSARIRSESLSMHNKGKKRRRASSGTQGDLSNPRGYYKAARAIRRVRGKQATKAGLSDANPSPMVEEKSNKSSQEDRDWEAEPCMFAGVSAQQYTDGIRWSLKV